MGQGRKVLRCIRCGEALQTTNPKGKGYISPEFLNDQNEITAIYCDECYNAISLINARVQSSHDDQAVINYFKKLRKDKTVIFYIIDLFTFSGELDEDSVAMMKGKVVVVVGTKTKLFGNSFNANKMKNFVFQAFKEKGIEPLNVFLVDKNDKSIDGIIDSFKRHFLDEGGDLKGRDAFMVGRKNSGKTTLITAFLKKFSNQSNENISVEWLNKNLKATIVPLPDGNKFYELPDLSNNNSVISKVEKAVQNLLIPKENLDTHSGSLKGGDAVQIGSIAGFEVTSGDSTYYKYYCARPVEAKKVAASKFNDSFKNNMINKLVRPVSSNFITMLDFEVFEFVFEKDGIYHEIAAEGLGFIIFKGVGQTIRVCVPKGVFVSSNLGRV